MYCHSFIHSFSLAVVNNTSMSVQVSVERLHFPFFWAHAQKENCWLKCEIFEACYAVFL